MRILMVCLGNICRSPLAEALLRKKIEERGLAGVHLDSAGTSGYHTGEPPDTRTRRNALNHDVDLSALRARQFSVTDFERFDRIYVMDHSNREDVLSLARTATDQQKVDLLLNCLEPGCESPVPDPYFGGEEGFEEVFNLLDQATAKLADELEAILNEGGKKA